MKFSERHYFELILLTLLVSICGLPFPKVATAQYGPNWKSLGTAPGVGGYIQCVFFFDTLNGVVAGGRPYCICYTKDGFNWKESTIPTGVLWINSIRSINGKLYATSTVTDVLVSIDSGVTWTLSGLNVVNVTDLYQESNGTIKALFPPEWHFAKVDNLHYIETVDSGTLRVSSNGGSSWNVIKPSSIVGDPSQDRYGCYGDTCSKVFFALLPGSLYRSTDLGITWIPICSGGNNVGGDDLDGAAGEAYSAQDVPTETVRISDYGANWNNCGGPSDGWGTSTIYVFGRMGEDVVVPDRQSIWMTTNGGDGAIDDPINTIDTTYINTQCGDIMIPVTINGSIGGIATGVSIIKDSLSEFDIKGPKSFTPDSGVVDTLWVQYTPHSIPGVSKLTLNFQNNFHCSDWPESRTIIVTETPPYAYIVAPKSFEGTIQVIDEGCSIIVDSCQTLVIDSIIPSLPERMELIAPLPDTVAPGYHDSALFQFDPRDTSMRGVASIEVKGYFLGTTIPFDTVLYIEVAADNQSSVSEAHYSYDSSEQNYPNPVDAASGFNTTIPFTTTAEGIALIRIVDQTGKEVLKDNEDATYAGQHFFYFSAKDLPAGTYYYTIEFPHGVVIANKTMLVVK